MSLQRSIFQNLHFSPGPSLGFGVDGSHNAWKLSALWDLGSVSSRGCCEKHKAKSLKSIFLAEGFSFSTKRNWLFLWTFPFYLSLLTVHFQSCYAEKKPCREDGLRSGQVWGGPPKLNLNFIIFWLRRTTGLKRSPFGQTSVRFQGEHHVKRTPGEYWVTKFTLTCLTASKSWEPAE